MKILTTGTLPNEKIWHGICHYCKSTAEAKEGELTNINYRIRCGEDPFSWEICPVCKNGPYGGMIFYRQD